MTGFILRGVALPLFSAAISQYFRRRVSMRKPHFITAVVLRWPQSQVALWSAVAQEASSTGVAAHVVADRGTSSRFQRSSH